MEWLAVRVEVAEAAADVVANFLLEAGAPAVVTAISDEAPPPAGRARLEVHVPAADHARVTAELARYLASLAAVEPLAAEAAVATGPVPAIDWEAAFRGHHRPVVVGKRLLVAPPWDVPDGGGRQVLVIEPGMAFGTGQHATTRTCLEEIEAVLGAGGVGTALDVGTGSGVLAAALARLGVPRVTALDDDPVVLPLARANLRRNGAAAVLLLAGRTDAVRARFDLVVANLLARALVADAPALAAAVAPAGCLIVSGLLDTQVAAVAAAYPGWRIARERGEGPWRTLRLARRG